MFFDFQAIQEMGWTHYVPFAALLAKEPVPENRPAMTRIIEQGFVGIVAAAIGSYVTINVHQTEIATLKQQRVESEARTAQAVSELSAQISELRQVLLSRTR